MDAVMAQSSTLDSGQSTPTVAVPTLPAAAPTRAPLTAPSMPSLAPTLAPPPAPASGLPAPTGLVSPGAQPFVPAIGGAPVLAPLSGGPGVLDVPAWARAVPAAEITPVLPMPLPTVAPASMPVEPTAEVPEPVYLAAALDAAGAPLVPTSQTVAGRKAAELRAARRKRAQRIKIGAALTLLAVGALAGPPLVRWIADEVNGGGEPIAPEAPAVVELDAPAG